MTEILAHWYSSESTQRELVNDRVKMVFDNLFILVLWTKVASALERLIWARDLIDSQLCPSDG